MKQNMKPKYANVSIAQIKSKQTLTQMYRHIYRKKDVPNADPERTKFNRELVHLEHAGFTQAFNEITDKEKIKVRSGNNLATHLVMTAPEMLSGEKLENWLRVNNEWLKERFHDTHLISVVYHADEHSQHIHAIIIPTYNGRLSSKHYIPNYGEFHTEYSEVVSCFGYSRGRKGSAGNYKTINKLKEALECEIEKRLPEPEDHEDIHEYYARVQKIYEKSNLKNLVEKELIDYEKRKIEAQKDYEIRQISKENSELTAKIRELTKDDADEKKSSISIDKDIPKSLSFTR